MLLDFFVFLLRNEVVPFGQIVFRQIAVVVLLLLFVVFFLLFLDVGRLVVALLVIRSRRMISVSAAAFAFATPTEFIELVVRIFSFYVLDDAAIVVSASVTRTFFHFAEFRSIAHVALRSSGPVNVAAFATLPIIGAEQTFTLFRGRFTNFLT
jgi:hypothetical protein